MCQWLWKTYVDSRGESAITSWRKDIDIFVWTEFENNVKFLDGQPPPEWKRPYVGTLRHDCKGLFEIRFKVNNVQYRPIGYYSGEMEFTILFFAIEKGGQFVPPTTCKQIAQKRKKEIEEGRSKTNEFWFEKRESKKHRC